MSRSSAALSLSQEATHEPLAAEDKILEVDGFVIREIRRPDFAGSMLIALGVLALLLTCLSHLSRQTPPPNVESPPAPTLKAAKLADPPAEPWGLDLRESAH